MISNSLIGTLVVLSLSTSHAGLFSRKKDKKPENNTGIVFANSIPDNQRDLMIKDLTILKTLAVTDEDKEASRLYKTEVSAANYESWLMQRSRYVVPESFELSSSAKIIEQFYSYPNSELPDMEKGTAASPGGRVKTVMSNIGAAMYLGGKKMGSLIGLDIPGVGVVSVKSPRVGIFQIGEGHFMPLLRRTGGTDFESYANSLFRLSTFFHEARHSDGNAKSLAFPHAVCPEGHNYAGYNACDKNLNGPYTLGATFLKSVAGNCTECSESEKEALRNTYMDSYTRIIKSVKQVTVGQDIADTLRSTCKTLKDLGSDISTLDACKNLDNPTATTTANEIASVELDDTPEGEISREIPVDRNADNNMNDNLNGGGN